MANTPPNLAPDYYLTNFRFLLDWVRERYGDLLKDNEQHFIAAFLQLEKDAQCLLVRLSSRKGPLFRRDKLNYGEISSIDGAAAALTQAGLLSSDFEIDVHTLAAALTKPELLVLFSEQLSGMKQARKEVLVTTVAEQFSAPRSWQDWTHNLFGAAWHLDNQPIIDTLLLLFFGNSYQDLTEFVLQDLGLFRYENYTIDHQHRVFKSRTEVEQYQLLSHLHAQLDGDCTPEILIQLAAQIPLECTSEKLQRRRAKSCNHIAMALERAEEHDLALKLYTQSHLPPARERRIRILEKQSEHSQAWALLNQLLEQPANEQELQVAQRMAPRIAKKLKITVNRPPALAIRTHHEELIRLMDEQGKPLRVEETVRRALDSTQAPCIYAENALLLGLFGLWLWPQMFGAVEGAFANPFQAAPLDLYQENFVANREGIGALWQSLQSDNYRHEIRTTWQNKYGIANHFVQWSFLTDELLDLALNTIPAAHLGVIFKRLLFDLKNNRSGLPDLIQFYPEKKTYRMIEVKGPGDRIQDNQQRWMEYFAQHQISAEVFYVRWK